MDAQNGPGGDAGGASRSHLDKDGGFESNLPACAQGRVNSPQLKSRGETL